MCSGRPLECKGCLKKNDTKLLGERFLSLSFALSLFLSVSFYLSLSLSRARARALPVSLSLLLFKLQDLSDKERYKAAWEMVFLSLYIKSLDPSLPRSHDRNLTPSLSLFH